eukprot:scpid111755/ scgid24153/ 
MLHHDPVLVVLACIDGHASSVTVSQPFQIDDVWITDALLCNSLLRCRIDLQHSHVLLKLLTKQCTLSLLAATAKESRKIFIFTTLHAYVHVLVRLSYSSFRLGGQRGKR